MHQNAPNSITQTKKTVEFINGILAYLRTNGVNWRLLKLRP